jgi:hypothetical protein
MHDYLQVRTKVFPSEEAALATNIVDFGATGAVKAVFNFSVPVEILKWGIVIDTAEGWTGDGVVVAEKYVTPGVNTNAVQLGTMTINGTYGAGSVFYNDLSLADEDGETAEDGSTRYESPRNNFDSGNKFILDAGQQFVVGVPSNAATTGQGHVFVQYVERPFAGVEIDGAVKVTS